MCKPSAHKLVVVFVLLGLVLGAVPVRADSTSDVSCAFASSQGPAMRPITIKFEGLVQQCALPLPGTWVIADVSMVVTEKTTITPPGRLPEPGDYAVVTALREDTRITATRIVLLPVDDTSARTIEFRGVISALPPGPAFQGEWIVGGVSVTLTSRGQLSGVPVLGHYAHVIGWLKNDRAVEAVSITALNPADELARFEFQGTIQSALGTTTRLITISGVTGLVTEYTQVEGTLRIGAVAEVSGKRLPGGQLFFERVRVLPDAEREVRLRGYIHALDATVRVWDVAGIRVLLSDLTFVDEVRGRAAPGMFAEVVAVQWGDQLYALRVRVERPE